MTWFLAPAKNRAYAGGETAKIRWEVLPWTQGSGLDIGCGDHKLWPGSIGLDRAGRGADLRGDVRDLSLIADGQLDYVYSSHCLEDLDDTEAALREWWRVLKVGGHLVLHLPHKDHYPNIGRPGANPAHKHDFLPEDIVRAMQAAAPDWVMRENQVRCESDEYSFLQVYTRRPAGKGQGAMLAARDPAKRCIIQRYGGFGDVLVAAGTFPHLKAEGWHITVYTGPRGRQVLRHDPHVDELVCHELTELAPRQFREMTEYLRGRAARFVSFSGSFEGLLLADPRSPSYSWPHAMREHYLGGNYMEAAHRVAGVPLEWRQKHHATALELARAREWRAGMPCLAVLVASGSGVNKVWPGAAEYAARLVERGVGMHVVVVGDLAGVDYPEHPRVHVLAETWSIRRTLALALVADLVIGPETGVLNAVALEPMPKIALLSHSSGENLTKHWTNTAALAGDVSCYPCHRLHGDWAGCRQDPETKRAACQAAIPVESVLRLTAALLPAGHRLAA